VTTQWLSVADTTPERAAALTLPRLDVLEARRHGNKLKVGHLRGNRFELTVRNAANGAADRAARIVDRLVRRGVPNRFGEQRFGSRGQTHKVGEALVRGDHETFVRELVGGNPGPERDPDAVAARTLFNEGRLEEAHAVMPARLRAERKCLHALIRFGGDWATAARAVPKRMREIYVSAFQSWLFNAILERRLDGIDRIEEGDIAYLHKSTGIFTVEDAAREQPRCRAFEISPSGPLFGAKCPVARGRPGALEAEVLAAPGLEARRFPAVPGIRLRGLRRPLRAPLHEVSLRAVDATTYTIAFALPAGSFATSVMHEIMK
jgi:tRNA pseudouridine13 synthase